MAIAAVSHNFIIQMYSNDESKDDVGLDDNAGFFVGLFRTAIWHLNTGLALQGKLNRSEFKHYQIAASVASAAPTQNDQASTQAQGSLRLRRHVVEKRLQHPHRVHALPLHLRCRGRAALQRQVLLLQR